MPSACWAWAASSIAWGRDWATLWHWAGGALPPCCMHWRRRRWVLAARASCWGWARPATSRLPSRPGRRGAGLMWIVGWLLIYREPARHPRLSRGELDYIRSEPAESDEHIPWRVLIANRPVWGLIFARFLTDPVWWFYLYWGPKFLNSQFGWKLDRIGLPLAAMYLVSSGGGIFGGWLYSLLTEHGRGNNAARKLAMLACALMVLPIVL